LTQDEEITAVVQVNGKVRARLEVSPRISEAELEKLAFEASPVKRAIEGKVIAKVIVRAPKIVNIAVKG
ncbi:MAG: hypothetical protein ACTH31_11270, partial [Pseudoclavibacter sp.]